MILTLRWKHDLFGLLIGQNSHDNACVIQHEYRQVIWEQSLQCGSEVKQVLRFLENMLRDPFPYLPLKNVIFVWTVLKAFEQVDCISDFQLKKTEGHYESHLLDVFANTWYTNTLVEISCFHIPTSPHSHRYPRRTWRFSQLLKGKCKCSANSKDSSKAKETSPVHQLVTWHLHENLWWIHKSNWTTENSTKLGCSLKKHLPKNKSRPIHGGYIFGVFLI